MYVAGKNRRRKCAVGDHDTVLDFGNTGDRQTDMSRMGRSPYRIHQPRMCDIDFFFLPNGRGRIDNRLATLNVARRRIFPAAGHLDCVDGRLRDSEPDDLAG